MKNDIPEKTTIINGCIYCLVDKKVDKKDSYIKKKIKNIIKS